MSHFTVLVIGNNVDEQLAPFNEQVDKHSPYVEFKETETEGREEYETKTIEKVRLKNGKLVSPYDKQFKIPGALDQYKVPAGLKEEEVPLKEIYKTFDAFMKDYRGDKKDPKLKKYGYYHNPRAKWDWYSIGGRWTGFFKLKQAVPAGEVGVQIKLNEKEGPIAIHGSEAPTYKAGTLGVSGVGNNKPPEGGEGRADSALKGDIDFEYMRARAAEEARKEYELVESIFDGNIPKLSRTWEEIYDDQSIPDIVKKREVYRNQPALKLWNEKLQKVEREFRKNPDFDREDPRAHLVFLEIAHFDVTKDEFVKRAAKLSTITFALLKDGQWYERGEMGWWAVVSNEKDRDEWAKQFNALLDSIPDDTLLTVVDCHI